MKKNIYFNNHIIKVDREKTIELYKKLPLISEKEHCGCEDCKLFTKQILQASSEILALFDNFGVDPKKEAEVWRCVADQNNYDTYMADYHFIGHIQDVDTISWFKVNEAKFSLSNYTQPLPNPMVPKVFEGPLVELNVEITMPHIK